MLNIKVLRGDLFCALTHDLVYWCAIWNHPASELPDATAEKVLMLEDNINNHKTKREEETVRTEIQKEVVKGILQIV